MGESTLEWSGVSPHFFFTIAPAFYVPQHFLVYFCEIHLPLSMSIPPLPLFLISTFYFYPIGAPYTHSGLLPLRLKRSQMLLYERQSRSVIFFQPLLQEVGPFVKKKKKEEQRKRVVGFREALGERLMTKMYFQNSRLSFHSCTWSNAWAHIRIYTLLKNALLALGILTLVVTFFFELSIHPWLYL